MDPQTVSPHPTARRSSAQWPVVLAEGSLASLASAIVLLWRSRRDGHRAPAAINAPSHWVWGGPALRREGVDWHHTALGYLIHHLSSLFWAAGYRWLRGRRRLPRAATTLVDGAAVAALAAWVDLRVVPHRVSPGFQHHLSRSSLVAVYAAFGLGLAAGGLLRRRAGPGACSK